MRDSSTGQIHCIDSGKLFSRDLPAAGRADGEGAPPSSRSYANTTQRSLFLIFFFSFFLQPVPIPNRTLYSNSIAPLLPIRDSKGPLTQVLSMFCYSCSANLLTSSCSLSPTSAPSRLSPCLPRRTRLTPPHPIVSLLCCSKKSRKSRLCSSSKH